MGDEWRPIFTDEPTEEDEWTPIVGTGQAESQAEPYTAGAWESWVNPSARAFLRGLGEEPETFGPTVEKQEEYYNTPIDLADMPIEEAPEYVPPPDVERERPDTSDQRWNPEYLKTLVKEDPPGLDNPKARETVNFMRSRYGDEVADRLELPYYLAEIYGRPIEEFTENDKFLDAFVGIVGGDMRGEVQLAKDYYRRGQYNKMISDIGMMMVSESLAGNTENLDQYLMDIERLYAEMPAPMDEDLVKWYFKPFIKAAEMGPMMVEAAKEATPFALGTGAGVATAVAATGIGAPVAMAWVGGAWTAGFTTSLIKQMTGANMVRMVQEDGVDPKMAAWASLGIGIAQGVLEQAQFSKIAKLVPGGASGIAKVFQNAVTKTLGKGGKGVAITRGISRLAGTYTQELLEEEAQYLVEAYGDNIIASLREHLQGEDVDYNTAQDIINGMQETLDQSWEPILGMMAVPGVIGLLKDVMTAEARTSFEEGEPSEASNIEKVIRVVAKDTEDSDTFVEKVNEALGEEAVSDEDLLSMYEEENAERLAAEAERTLVEEAAEFDTPEEFLASKGVTPGPDEQMIKKAVDTFGITEDPAEAGYIMPEGQMLDFTGRHYAVGYEGGKPLPGEPDYLAGSRAVDHRELSGEEFDLGLESSGGTEGMIEFMQRSGAVRFDEASGSVASVGVPSLEQQSAIIEGLRYSDYANIEIWDENGDSIAFAEIDEPNRAKIKRFYKENAQPEAETTEDVGQLTAAWREAHTTDAMRESADVLQSDLDMGLFESADEFVSFAHAMHDEEALPDDDVLREMFGESSTVTTTDRSAIADALPEEGAYKKGTEVIGETPDGLKKYSYEINGPLYRGVTVEDWQRIQEQGYIDTDMRGAISEHEGLNLATRRGTATEYIPSESKGVVLAIDASGLDIWGIEGDDYPRTNDTIPVDAVIAVSPVFDKGAEAIGFEVSAAARRLAWNMEKLEDAKAEGNQEDISMWESEIQKGLDRYFEDDEVMQQRVVDEVASDEKWRREAREDIDRVEGKPTIRTAEESNAEFIADYDTKEQVAALLTELGTHYEEEVRRYRDRGMSLREANATLGSQWDPSVLANARRMIGNKGGLSDAAYRSIRGKLHKNVEYYRLLLADLRGDTDAMREIQAQMEGAEVEPEMARLLEDAEARAEQAIAEEEAGSRVVEPQMIEPEKRTTKQQIQRSLRGVPMEKVMTYRDLVKMRMDEQARGARAGARGERAKAQAKAEQQKMLDRAWAELEVIRKDIRGYRDNIKKLQERVNKWVKKGKGRRIDPMYVEQIEGVLEGLSMTKLSAKKKAKLEATYKYLEENKDDHDLPDEVITDLARLNEKSWDQMSADELHDVHDGVATLLMLNDRKQKLRSRGEERAFEAERDTLLGEIKVGKQPKRTYIGPKKESGVKKAYRTTKNLVGLNQSRPDVVISQVFGNEGVGRDVVGRQVELGEVADEAYRQRMFSEFQANLHKEGFEIDKKTPDWIEEDVTTTVGDQPFTMERGERISMYMHSLDEDNRESMLTGIGFRRDVAKNAPQQITEEDLEAIINDMTEEEFMWARAAADIFRKTGEDQKQVMLAQNGWAPEFFENYMPKDTMPVGRSGSDVDTENYTNQQSQMHPHRVGVDKRQLKQRKDVRTPIFINNIAQVANDVIMRASAYVNLEEPLRNAHKLLNDQQVRAAMLSTPEGTDVYHYLTKYLRDVAGESRTYSDLTRFFDRIRPGITKYALGGNLWVAFKQALSAPFAAMYIKPKYLFMGMHDELVHPRISKDTHEANSPHYLERRKGGFSRDIAEAKGKNSPGSRLLNERGVGEWLMKPSQTVDAKTVSGVMNAAVRQAMDEFAKGEVSRDVRDAIGEVDVTNLTPEEQMTLAYQFADYVSNRTQPQFAPGQLSQWQRSGTLGKLSSQFSAFTNQELNMFRRALNDAKHGHYGKISAFAVSFVANALGVFILDTLRDRVRGKDEEDLKSIAEVGLDSVAGMFYGIRDFEKAVMSQFQDNMELPIMRMGERLVRGGKEFVNVLAAEDGEERMKATARFTEAALDLVMMKFGIPYVFKRMGKNVIERIVD